MSLARQLLRHGKDIEDCRASIDSKPTLTRAKPVRPANSYRGARRNTYFELIKEVKSRGETPVPFRNFCHAIWTKGEFSIAPEMHMTQQSFVSKNPSKYMPHEAKFDGGRYTPSIRTKPYASVQRAMLNQQLVSKGLPPLPVLSAFRGFGGRNR